MSANDATNVGGSNLVTIQEAAARLGKSERTIQRYMQSGKLHAVEISGKTMIQFAGMETPDTMSAVSAQPVVVSANDGQNVGTVSREVVELMRDTIRRQDANIARLEADKAHLQSTIDGLFRMFPTPRPETDDIPVMKSDEEVTIREIEIPHEHPIQNTDAVPQRPWWKLWGK